MKTLVYAVNALYPVYKQPLMLLELVPICFSISFSIFDWEIDWEVDWERGDPKKKTLNKVQYQMLLTVKALEL